MRVQMSYHIFSNLSKLLDGDLAKKSGRESFPLTQCIDNVTVLFHLRPTANVSTNVNSRKMSNIWSKMINVWDIYIGNTHKTSKKIMDCHLSDILWILKNGQILDSFASHFEQNFDATTSHTDLLKYMTLKLVNHLNLIGTMKTFMKPNWNLCMEERLRILKKIRNKCVMFTNKKLEIYVDFWHKTTFYQFFLTTDEHV